MIVRCANCHTEFSLDDQEIGPEGATVRCSVCSYVFPVEAPPGAGEHPWQIRTVEDLLFTAPDLATLRTWIAEGRLHPDDQVSRTGKHWLRLGDMPEFSTAFSGFSDLPQMFEELEAAPGLGAGSALDELGPPPGFGETMPVVQGVDTGILDVRSDTGDYGVPVVSRTAAVERPASGRSGSGSGSGSGSVGDPSPSSYNSETSGPAPFPLAELPVADGEPVGDAVDDREPRRVGVDESAVRMRPRPHTPTRRVSAIPLSAIPEIVDDEPIEEVRRRPPRPTVRYGSEDVHGPASMLDAVTSAVDEADEAGPDVRSTAAAVERAAVQPREASGKRRAADEPVGGHASSGARRAASAARDGEQAKGSRRSSSSRDDVDPISSEERAARSRRRELTDATDEPRKRRRSPWPLLAGLGLLAGVAVVFGVPSIRAKVMAFAGSVAGEQPRFDLDSLAELGQARDAMASLDPVALGRAEAALQGRLDEGKVPPEGVAEMKLAQVELLATRSLDRAMTRAIEAAASGAAETPRSGVDDVELATQILGGLVAEEVVDRDHMRRVRALVRLAQGRPEAEILPLLPEEDSAELRQLVEAAPLWRDSSSAVPAGAVAGLEGLASRSTLAELALMLAYSRAGDDVKALQLAAGVLASVPAQPTALALQAKASGGAVPVPSPEGDTKVGDSAADSGGAQAGADGGSTTSAPEPTPEPTKKDPKPARTESVDSMIERGCRLVESGDAAAGLDLLRKAKARRSTDLDLLSCMGKGHVKAGRTREGLKAFEDALRVSPRFAEALLGAARAADKLGDSEQAVRYYRRLLEVRKGDAKALAYIEAHGG